MNAQLDTPPPTDDRVYKLIDFLSKRLEHTLTHTQTSTKLIYLVNGAILAAVYFAFGMGHPLWFSCAIASVLSLLLSIVNLFHANFIHVQSAWYRAIDEEIRKLFLHFDGMSELWPDHLGIARDRVLDDTTRYPWLLRSRKTHDIYVNIHLIISLFLAIATIVFVCVAFWAWCTGT